MSVHALPPVLDTAAATPLHAELLRRIEGGEAIALDGAAVAKIGIACLQLLAAARATAGTRDLGFRVADPSPTLCEMASLAGLDVILDQAG